MGKNPRLIPVEKGNSFFTFANKYCLEEGSGGEFNRAFHRLCSLMRKMDVMTAVVEDVSETDNVIADEYTALCTYYGQSLETKTYQFTFKDEYINSLDKSDFNGNSFTQDDKTKLAGSLPSRFWLSEVTLPALYTANKSKIIGVFYKCDCAPWQNEAEIFERWIQVRFPNVLVKRDVIGVHQAIPLSVDSHYPLVRFELPHEALDW